MQVTINADHYDDATLRLCCAIATVTTISELCEGRTAGVNPDSLMETMFGLKLMLEDAYNKLSLV